MSENNAISRLTGAQEGLTQDLVESLRGKLANCPMVELGVMFLFPAIRADIIAAAQAYGFTEEQVTRYIEPCLDEAVVRATDGKIRLTFLKPAPIQLPLDL